MAQPILSLSLSLDERGLAPGVPVRAHLVAEVRAVAEGIERARPPLSLVFAVDVSGSMAGPPLEHVASSIDRLVGLLEPTDRVGVAVFSDAASEVVPVTAVDAATKKLVSARVHRLVAEGWTHMESGLGRAAAMMPARGVHERQVIVLLSDGAPNRGRVTAAELAEIARSMRPDISVATLGYGAHHNEDVLSRIADAGAGRYHFIADPSVCELEFAQAIGVQGDAVAEAIELHLVPAEGVEIARFLGSPEIRFGAGGLKIALPDLLDGSRHVTVAEVDLRPPREPGPWAPLSATIAYRRAGEREAHSIDQALSIPVGSAVGPHPPARAEVRIAQADEARAEARSLADRGQFEGAAAVLRKMIQAIEGEPGFVRNDGSKLAEALEQLVDEAVAMERKPSREAYEVFRKAQVQSSLLGDAPPMSVATPLSARMIASVAGRLPDASLVVVGGGVDMDRRFPLDEPRIMIGRTAAAKICLPDTNVSRMHAMILAQHGRFFASDLGSTNTTCVNGEPIRRPVPLSNGDLLQVGDFVLRYEEARKA